MFLLLPPELFKEISSEMDIQDVKNLRLTCKASSETLAAQVLDSITINLSKSVLDKEMHGKLQCLATRPCATSHATHELTIKSFAPANTDYYEPFTPDREPQPSLDETKKFLFDALCSFQNVRKVSWQAIVDERTWLQATVMDALRALPKINSLHVWIGHCRLPVPFHWFSGLQEISIDGTNGQHHTESLENLAKMVSHSPQLNSINMRGVSMYGVPFGKAQSLHQLFQYYPQNAPPLNLRRLVLDTCLLRFDDTTIPHLKYLTSLSLTKIKDTSDSKPTPCSDGVNSDTEEIKREQKRWGSSLQEIWSALLKADIYLEEITVDVVVPAFISYLASYSGLRILNLTCEGLHQEDSDHFATQFYAKPLANHVRSLRILDIRAIYEGLWCVGDHNLSLISQCLNLKHLDVSIISSQVDLDPIVGPSSERQDIIKRVIDMAAMSMPQLDILTIRPAVPEDERFAICGNSIMNHFCYSYGKIAASIDTYEAPRSCRRLPLLSVGSQRFLERQSIVNDGRLRYTPSPNNPPFDPDYDLEF